MYYCKCGKFASTCRMALCRHRKKTGCKAPDKGPPRKYKDETERKKAKDHLYYEAHIDRW